MAGCLFVGGLNQIAQLASVLYLLSYSTVNIACLFLEWASVRPFWMLLQRTVKNISNYFICRLQILDQNLSFTTCILVCMELLAVSKT